MELKKLDYAVVNARVFTEPSENPDAPDRVVGPVQHMNRWGVLPADDPTVCSFLQSLA